MCVKIVLLAKCLSSIMQELFHDKQKFSDKILARDIQNHANHLW